MVSANARHASASSSSNWRSQITPLRITWVALLLFAIFIVWFFLTVTPILAVETRYQYKSALQNIFGVNSLRAVFVPSINWDFETASKYQEYGITIPSLFIDEPVVFNVDPNDKAQYMAALQHGIAHASGTSLPDSGGIGYYFAHSSSPELVQQYNAIFYTLGKLKTGDEIFIWFQGKKYRYVVTGSKETTPDDLEFLHQTYNKETIVLQTCWPPGTTARRLLVFAERQDLE